MNDRAAFFFCSVNVSLNEASGLELGLLDRGWTALKGTSHESLGV